MYTLLPMMNSKPNLLWRSLVNNTLYLPVPTKALLLFVVMTVCSLLSTFDLVPQLSFSQKNNPLNVYLVKYSWGWTLMCLIPVVMFTSFLYSGMTWNVILKHFARIGVSHVIWFVLTTLFVLLDEATGTCKENEISGRTECIHNGHSWEGFDISGHIFLLIYCILVLTEECAGIQWEVWNRYEDVWIQEHHVANKFPASLKQRLLSLYRLSTWVVSALELFALAQVLLWTFMVTTTSLFFHSMLEKLLGFLLASMFWYFTYNWLYGQAYMPCRPNEGCLHPARL